MSPYLFYEQGICLSWRSEIRNFFSPTMQRFIRSFGSGLGIFDWNLKPNTNPRPSSLFMTYGGFFDINWLVLCSNYMSELLVHQKC